MLLVLSRSLAIIVIDATIVIVALPQIKKDFSISLKDLEWITSLYALIFGSFLLSWRKLSDLFGRKLIFMAGISTFIVGSIIDGFSLNLSQMLVGRVIQGFGAAMASPSTLSILTTTFTGKSRNVAFGIWGATAGAAAVLGPVLGGYFTTYISWRFAVQGREECLCLISAYSSTSASAMGYSRLPSSQWASLGQSSSSQYSYRRSRDCPRSAQVSHSYRWLSQCSYSPPSPAF